MSWLSSFLHPGRQYQAQQQAMQPYYQQAQGGMQPYNQAGQDAIPGMNTAMQRLMDPAALQAEWMKGYETSPQAQQLQQQAQEQGLGAASSMGLMGSQPALQAIQGGASNIGMADRDSYLSSLMDKYKTGIGLGENMMGTGAQMAGQMGQNSMQMADLMGTSAANQAGAGGRMLGGLGGGALGLAGSALGGPMGSWLGNKLGVGGGQWQNTQPWLTGGR